MHRTSFTKTAPDKDTLRGRECTHYSTLFTAFKWSKSWRLIFDVLYSKQEEGLVLEICGNDWTNFMNLQMF